MNDAPCSIHPRSRLTTTLALLTTYAALEAAQTPNPPAVQAVELRDLDGGWIYVEDRTEGHADEDQQPSMSARFGLRVVEGAIFMVRRDGETRIALDGSVTEVAGKNSTSRMQGGWKDCVFAYGIGLVNPADGSRTALIRRQMRLTADRLLVHVAVDSPDGVLSVALYRHPQDIALPAPARATEGDLAWLAGAWVGTRGTGGATPTAFVLTEMVGRRAVFENPQHDFPQRIV